MPRSGIYAITNTVNGFRYVGSAVDFEVRKARHLRELRQGIHHSHHLQNAYNKYGPDVFEFSILEETIREKAVLFERESFWIAELKPEYNVGQLAATHLGVKRSEATKRKMSEKASLRTHSEESKEKMRAKKLGTRPSEETRQRMSKSQAGRKWTDEQKQNLAEVQRQSWANRTEEERQAFCETASQRQVGIRRSLESRQKQSATNTGRTHTEEAKQRMSEIHKARWQKRKQQDL